MTEDGKITRPVSIEDIRRTLGAGSGDAGTFCTSAKINAYARYRPVRMSKAEQLADEDWRNADTGCGIPAGTGADGRDTFASLAAMVAGEPKTWEGFPLRPRGSGVSPVEHYRLTDFENYYHKADFVSMLGIEYYRGSVRDCAALGYAYGVEADGAARDIVWSVVEGKDMGLVFGYDAMYDALVRAGRWGGDRGNVLALSLSWAEQSHIWKNYCLGIALSKGAGFSPGAVYMAVTLGGTAAPEIILTLDALTQDGREIIDTADGTVLHFQVFLVRAGGAIGDGKFRAVTASVPHTVASPPVDAAERALLHGSAPGGLGAAWRLWGGRVTVRRYDRLRVTDAGWTTYSILAANNNDRMMTGGVFSAGMVTHDGSRPAEAFVMFNGADSKDRAAWDRLVVDVRMDNASAETLSYHRFRVRCGSGDEYVANMIWLERNGVRLDPVHENTAIQHPDDGEGFVVMNPVSLKGGDTGLFRLDLGYIITGEEYLTERGDSYYGYTGAMPGTHKTSGLEEERTFTITADSGGESTVIGSFTMRLKWEE